MKLAIVSSALALLGVVLLPTAPVYAQSADKPASVAAPAPSAARSWGPKTSTHSFAVSQTTKPGGAQTNLPEAPRANNNFIK